MKRRQYTWFYWFNILIPLLTGLLLYFYFRREALVVEAIGRKIPLPAIQIEAMPSRLAAFHRNYAADLLWAYSLTFALVLTLGFGRNNMLCAFIVGVAFEIVIEYSQKFNLIRGTFDYFDIVFEFLSTCFALIVISIYNKKEDKNEKNR